MRDSDLPAFQARLDAVCSMLSRGRYVPDAVACAVFFRALQAHPLPTVLAAFDAHVSDPDRGRFTPLPADILAKIAAHQADDGRPGVEEAWAVAVRANDETQSVVWTEEIALAYGAALPILQTGDQVGARMAFKEAYTRLVDVARRGRAAPRWSASLGFDPERREKAVAAAVAAGQLERSELVALPAPRGPVLLLEHASRDGIPPNARAALLALREWLTTPQAEGDSPDAAAKAETLKAKTEAHARVERYTVPVPTKPPVKHWSETDDRETMQ